MTKRRRVRTLPKRRGGYLVVEVVIAVLLLLIASIAVFQYGIAMTIQQAVSHSATVAAREAGKGATIDQLVDVVETVLRVHQLRVGEHLSIRLDTSTSQQQRGDLECPEPGSNIGPDEVRVTVCVDMAAKPFINPLSAYGIDFRGRTISISSLVKKE